MTVIGNQDAAVTIPFINGFGTDQSIWSDITKAFVDKYRLLLLDNAGTGRCFIQVALFKFKRLR